MRSVFFQCATRTATAAAFSLLVKMRLAISRWLRRNSAALKQAPWSDIIAWSLKAVVLKFLEPSVVNLFTFLFSSQSSQTLRFWWCHVSPKKTYASTLGQIFLFHFHFVIDSQDSQDQLQIRMSDQTLAQVSFSLPFHPIKTNSAHFCDQLISYNTLLKIKQRTIFSDLLIGLELGTCGYGVHN